VRTALVRTVSTGFDHVAVRNFLMVQQVWYLKKMIKL
jgi:hypothetical protein